MNRFRLFMHSYMLCSLIGSILMLFDSGMAMCFYSVGASSPYIAFGVFAAAAAPLAIGIISLFWFCLFPVALIISYILAIKNRSAPFSIMVILDACVVVTWMIYSVFSANQYGVNFFAGDAVISAIMACIAIWLKGNKKTICESTGDSLCADEAEGPKD